MFFSKKVLKIVALGDLGKTVVKNRGIHSKFKLHVCLLDNGHFRLYLGVILYSNPKF